MTECMVLKGLILAIHCPSFVICSDVGSHSAKCMLQCNSSVGQHSFINGISSVHNRRADKSCNSDATWFVNAIVKMLTYIFAVRRWASLFFFGFVLRLFRWFLCVWLSVPVQVTDWKDSSPKWSMMFWWWHHPLLIQLSHAHLVLFWFSVPLVIKKTQIKTVWTDMHP